MYIEINSPLDMHLHLRDGAMLNLVAPLSARHFSAGLIMPNLVPPIRTIDDVVSYKKRIIRAIQNEKFTPYMTVFFHEQLDFNTLQALKKEILAVKMYPDGVTTNSAGGVKTVDLAKIGHIFEAMQTLEIPLCIHGETNDFVMDREKNFIPIYEMLAKTYPKLKIIMEHITTKESADFVEKYDNVYATITLHHLMITLDDVAGGLLQPHLFCKPIAKRPEDRQALLNLVLKGSKKVMFGSDSAPHTITKKEAKYCSAGVFTAPIAIQFLVELFEKHNAIDKLGDFLCQNAKDIYKINPPEKIVRLEKKEYMIPERYYDVVPFKHEQIVSWSFAHG